MAVYGRCRALCGFPTYKKASTRSVGKEKLLISYKAGDEETLKEH